MLRSAISASGEFFENAIDCGIRQPTRFQKLHKQTNMQIEMKLHKQLPTRQPAVASQPPRPPFQTAEQVRADSRRRVILNAQKGQTKPRPKGDPPKVPKSPDWAQPVSDRPAKPVGVPTKGSTVSPTKAAAPKLSAKAVKALEFAVRCTKRSDWSLNQRRLAAFHHLQSSSEISSLTPDELIDKS